MSYPNPSHSHQGAQALVQTFMQRVYQWMAAGLAFTGFVAYWASGNAGLMRSLHTSGMGIILFIALLGMVFWLSSQVMRMSVTAGVIGFLVFSGLMGLSLSYIFLAYTKASIASTFFVTSGTFAAISLYGWTTKQDLTGVGSFCMMGLIGVIIASLVNWFFKSPAFYWILTYVGLAVFIGLTAYDTQRLKQIQMSRPDAPDQLAILGALTLYLDFINMFLLLLRLLGNRR